MRHAIMIVFAALLAITPAGAQSPQPAPMPGPAAPSAESLAAARELIQVMKATDQLKVLLPNIFAALKPAIVQNRPEVAKHFDAIVPMMTNAAIRRVDLFAELLAGVYARNFSADELHDLIAFYRTPTGQKLVARQPVIMRESLAAGREFGQELTRDLKQQIIDELRKRGDNI
jgi:uncharacterized protein